MADKQSKWKTFIQELWDGREVYAVQGEYVRNHFFADFTEGTNHEAYPEYCPKGEIWVEQEQRPNDLLESLVHEVVESTLMKYKIEKDYDSAHDATNTISEAIRKLLRYAKGEKDIGKVTLYPEADAQPAPAGEQSAPLSRLLT